MDYFDDIAALASSAPSLVSISDAAEAYEKDGVDRMIKHWKRFAVNLPSPADVVERSEPFQSPPDLRWVKAYFLWRVKTGQGRIDDRVTIATLLKEFQQLRRCLYLAHDFVWARKEIETTKKFIKNLARMAGASTSMRPKSVAYAPDADNINFYMWNCSERVLLHPRMLVQFSFQLDVIKIWGLRTGEMTESSSHRGSNEGILYGDTCLSLRRWEGTYRYQVDIVLRNRKFCRADNGKIKTITLYEVTNPRERFRCPVRKFLGLALADDVFTEQKTPEAFEQRWIRPEAVSRVFNIDESKKQLPVCRRLKGKSISSLILSAISFNDLLKSACQDCGYSENVTSYAFRRGVANKVEAQASHKRAKEVLGQTSDRVWHAYAAPKIGVDAQAIAYDQPEDTVAVEQSQSINYTRDLGAPKPEKCTLGVHSMPSAAILKSVAKTLPNSRLCAIMKKARHEQFKMDREQFQQDVARETSESSDPSDGCSGDVIDRQGDPRPTPSPEFLHMLKYNPLQKEVINALWTAPDASLSQCIRPLMMLSNPAPFRALYPSPVLPPKDDSTCPYCRKSLRKVRSPLFALHLLDCHCRKHRTKFCFDCAQFMDEEDYKPHSYSCTEFDPDSPTYGVITWRGLLIREGRCPYGTRNCIDRRWRDAQKLTDHVEFHLRHLPEDNELACPHENCGECCSSKDQLRQHLHGAHRLHLLSTRDAFRSCQDPEKIGDES